ncbi:MAG: hypothetical protein BWX80_03542 [Candidatus Hydrogenedentes bacterium ADurb.Bin101]|nr:MAG: hypothetical protein BWX80_03542 [Candidatus Hydrogenedentes bacterium ADurb.Bin101]
MQETNKNASPPNQIGLVRIQGFVKFGLLHLQYQARLTKNFPRIVKHFGAGLPISVIGVIRSRARARLHHNPCAVFSKRADRFRNYRNAPFSRHNFAGDTNYQACKLGHNPPPQQGLA